MVFPLTVLILKLRGHKKEKRAGIDIRQDNDISSEFKVTKEIVAVVLKYMQTSYR